MSRRDESARTAVGRVVERGIQAWLRFWFHTVDTRALEVVRIGVGLTLLLSYLGQAGELEAFYSEQGWLPLADTPSLTEEWSTLSLLFVFPSSEALWALWGATVLAAVAVCLGWKTRIALWVLWIGHYSFTRRAPTVAYGVDDLCSNLLLVLCVVPVGRCFALDARRAAMLSTLGRAARSVGLRLIQVQMAIIMGFAGLEKVQGDDWWDGTGIWFAMTDWEFNFVSLWPFAKLPYLVNALSYGSVLLELLYPMLIWGRRTRGPILVITAALHLGVAMTMGLWLFSIGMLFGHFVFAPSTWLDRLGFGREDTTSPLPAGAAGSSHPHGSP